LCGRGGSGIVLSSTDGVARDMAQNKSGTEATNESLSFEDILTRLEGVVGKLEKGELPLEQALLTFEQGVGLARAGSRRLDEAERRIEILLADDEGVRVRPLPIQNKESSADE
jgi:exodeoxyribonuclease VII small subunit